MYGAANYQNQNYILWVNSADKSIALWQVDSNWAYVDGNVYGDKTNEYYTTEAL